MKNTKFETIWMRTGPFDNLALLMEEFKNIITNNSLYWDFALSIEDDTLLIKATRYESDEEYKKRMENNQKSEEQQKKIRYEEYLKLKKEFDI